MRPIFPPFDAVPPDATPEQRQALYEAWDAKLRAANPHSFDSAGNLLPWWRVLFNVLAAR